MWEFNIKVIGVITIQKYIQAYMSFIQVKPIHEGIQYPCDQCITGHEISQLL